MSDWQAQSDAAYAAWAEAQKSLWQSWAGMAQAAMAAGGPRPRPAPPGGAEGAAAPNGAAAGAEPGTPAHDARGAAAADLMAQWRRLADQAVGLWTAGADPSAREVAGGLLKMQDTVFQYARATGEAWQAVSNRLSTGQGWSEAVAAYAEALRRGWPGDPAAYAAAAGDTTEAWRLYLETVGRLLGPWATSLRQAPGHVGPAMAGSQSEFAALARLYWDAWEHTGGRLLESPSLGSTREFDEKLLDGFDAWMDYRRAVFEYQVVVGDAWAEAGMAVLEALKARADAGEPIDSLRGFTTLWTTVTDASMERAFRSEPFATAQGNLLNAAMRYRQRERAVVETLLRMTDVAAKSELDEAFHEIYLLRRELKALRHEVGALRAASDPGAPEGTDSPDAPKRRARRKPSGGAA